MDSHVNHEGSASVTSRPLQARSTYYAALAAFRHTREHYPWWLPSVALSRLAGISLRALTHLHPQLIGAVLLAFRDFTVEYKPGSTGPQQD